MRHSLKSLKLNVLENDKGWCKKIFFYNNFPGSFFLFNVFLSRKMIFFFLFRGCLFILNSNAFFLSHSYGKRKNCFHSSLFICFSTALFVFWDDFFKQFSISPFFFCWLKFFLPLSQNFPNFSLFNVLLSIVYIGTPKWTQFHPSDCRLNTRHCYWWKAENASTFSSVKNFKNIWYSFSVLLLPKIKSFFPIEIKWIKKKILIDFHIFKGKTLSSGRLEIPTTNNTKIEYSQQTFREGF